MSQQRLIKCEENDVDWRIESVLVLETSLHENSTIYPKKLDF